MRILGVDIGGSGIKAAPVETKTGRLLKPRERLKTPDPSTPAAVAKTVAELVEHFDWRGPIGCAFPAVIKKGVARTAANVDPSWIGTNLEKVISQKCSSRVYAINDADAAGMAEMRFGKGRGERGLAVMITLGTGIGSALFFDGKLIPNTELGHLVLRGKDAERRVSARAREKKDLSWKKWGKNIDEYLDLLEWLLCPDLFIIGGGASKEFAEFKKYLSTEARVTAAALKNDAGIVGAALAAEAQIKFRHSSTD